MRTIRAKSFSVEIDILPEDKDAIEDQRGVIINSENLKNTNEDKILRLYINGINPIPNKKISINSRDNKRILKKIREGETVTLEVEFTTLYNLEGDKIVSEDEQVRAYVPDFPGLCFYEDEDEDEDIETIIKNITGGK